jgi:hypothetical protein
MKKIILVFTFFFAIQINVAQKLKLGNVTIEELSQKVHPIDSSAAAAVIFKKGETTFLLGNDGEWSVQREVEMKIKIYKTEGLDYANQEVSYFVGGNTTENVWFSNAATYNLENGKIVKTKLSSEGKFNEEVNDDWKIKKITLPAVKEGSIIEYSYRTVSPYITRIDDWYFQMDIPIDYVEYKIYLPKYFKYTTSLIGFEDIEREEKSLNDNINSVVYKYKKENVPAIKEEKYVANIKNYTSILKYELASIDYPNQPIKNFALDWEGVTKTIYEHNKFGSELNYKSYFDDDIDLLIKNGDSDEVKMNKIFKFVQQKMNWNEKNGIYTDLGVKKAYKENVGNVSDINIMLVAMLRYAGLDANPVLLSTRSNGVAIFPNRSAFNYVVAAVQNGNEIHLLDATNKNSIPNILPLKTINWFGRLIKKDGTSFSINLMKKPISYESVALMANINEDGTIEGKIRKQMYNHNAFVFRERHGNLNENTYIENLEKKHNGIEISEYNIKNKKELSEPIIESFTFKHNNVVDLIGSKMYISPLLFYQLDENPFKLENRKYPVDFPYPFRDSYNFNLKVPENYEIEFIPNPITYVMENGNVSFTFKISVVNKNIQISSTFDVNETIIPASEYLSLKTLFKEMINKQAEKIILKRI